MLTSLFSDLYFIAPLTVIIAFIITMITIPKIIWVVSSRDLIDHPEGRSTHKKATPTMGGVSFFLTLVFIIFFIKPWDIDEIGVNLFTSLTLMFAIGLKDDLVLSSPKAKIGSEIIAILFILFCNCTQVLSLDGFLGVYTIPNVISYILVIIIILTIINAYNLIDGIDGLASVVGIVIFSIYTFIFATTGFIYYFLLSLSLVGILLAFLRYNLSSTKKIFMGDTGSLIIGFFIGFFTLKLLSIDVSNFSEFTFRIENKLIVIAGILFIPLFDTFRVIGIRLLNKKSPFYPDRNHIHHILIDSGLKHYKVSLFLGLLNLGVALSLIFLSAFYDSFKMFTILILMGVLFSFFFHQLKKNIKSKNVFNYVITTINFFF